MSEGSFISEVFDFSVRMLSPLSGKESAGEVMIVADFRFDADTSPLAPYINAVIPKALYYDNPPFIRFPLEGFSCTLYRSTGFAGAFSDRGQARGFVEKLVSFLNDIHIRRSSIEPNHKRYRHLSVLDVFKLLPRTNCRKCGFATCMAFAAALSRRKTAPHRCPGFSRPLALSAVYPVLDGKGNLMSTVSIDIDSEAGGSDARAWQQAIGGRKGNPETGSRPGKTLEENDLLAASLTERERAVLRLVAQGATNGEISELLAISPHTVKSHVVHIFNKLGVNDRTQAAVLATRHGIV